MWLSPPLRQWCIRYPLTYKNFLFLRTQVVPFLDGHDLFGFVDSTYPSPAATLPAANADSLPTPNPAFAPWRRQDHALFSMLVSSISDEVMSLAVGCRSSRALWDTIIQSLASSTHARMLNLIG